MRATRESRRTGYMSWYTEQLQPERASRDRRDRMPTNGTEGLQFFDLSHPWGHDAPLWPYFPDVKIERFHYHAKSGVLSQQITTFMHCTTLHVAARTDMPHCKGRMFEWFVRVVVPLRARQLPVRVVAPDRPRVL